MLGSLAGRESISKSNGSSVAPRPPPIACNAVPDGAACPDFLYAGLTGFPVELDGVGGPHAPFLKRKAHRVRQCHHPGQEIRGLVLILFNPKRRVSSTPKVEYRRDTMQCR
jgi:hypothetical protein